MEHRETNKPRSIGYAERARWYGIEQTPQDDQAFLRRLVTQSVQQILVVPAGVGRHVGWLAQTPCQITLADREPAMVDQLKTAIAHTQSESHIEAVVADMRYFRLQQRYDLIIVEQEAFQLLLTDEDALACLKACHDHLLPRGRLFLDIALFDPHGPSIPHIQPAYYDPHLPDGQLQAEWQRSLPAQGQLERSRIQCHTPGDVSIRFFYTERFTDGPAISYTTDLHLRRYTLLHIERLCHKVDLQVVHVYQDYETTPYDPMNAVRMLVLLTRVPESQVL